MNTGGGSVTSITCTVKVTIVDIGSIPSSCVEVQTVEGTIPNTITYTT